MLKTVLSVLYKNSTIVRNNKIQHKQIYYNYINKIGDSKIKLKIKYEDKNYTFEEFNIDDNYYVLYSSDELECISILIDKKKQIAELHGIDNYKTCINTTRSNQKVGSILLILTIKMLIKYKDKLNIKKIILVDNSIKICNTFNIDLPMMLILLNGNTLYGNTWYGKYGFRPVDITTYELDTIKNAKYENNIKIMNTMTISKANILNYIKLTNKKSLIIDVEKLLLNHPNYLLRDFINSLLHNYDKTCKYFNLFYKQLFDDIGLYNFHGSIFGLNL
jgi:hypothetical protein